MKVSGASSYNHEHSPDNMNGWIDKFAIVSEQHHQNWWHQEK